jgi:hypothetical protein
MKMKLSLIILSLAALTAIASTQTAPTISGDYLEVRSCDVYTGPCFANAEMNLSGKEGILVWSVREGSWNGISLSGLSVIAVVCTDGTLGDMSYQPRAGKAVLIVDAKADAQQREALNNLARSMAGTLIKEVVAVRTAPIEASVGACANAGCASVKAGNLVEVTTRCLGGHDHLCGNEETYYPPLTSVENAIPAFTERASFKGSGLNLTWEATDQRNAFLATFSR